MEVDAWPRCTSRACLIGNAGMRVVLRTGGAREGWPLVIEELNELESMEKDLLCVCICVNYHNRDLTLSSLSVSDLALFPVV